MSGKAYSRDQMLDQNTPLKHPPAFLAANSAMCTQSIYANQGLPIVSASITNPDIIKPDAVILLCYDANFRTVLPQNGSASNSPG